MKNNGKSDPLILSIFPSTRGFGFALFEGAWSPVDWGFRHVSGDKNATCVQKVSALIIRFKPELLLLEDCAGDGSNRGDRVEKLIAEIEKLSRTNKITVVKYSRAQIQECFDQFEAKTKHEIAEAIAGMLPEFPPQLPPPRKIWLPEDYRMSIFDAVSLIFTHFYFMAIKPNTKGK
jgi:hypothetical protein